MKIFNFFIKDFLIIVEFFRFRDIYKLCWSCKRYMYTVFKSECDFWATVRHEATRGVESHFRPYKALINNPKHLIQTEAGGKCHTSIYPPMHTARIGADARGLRTPAARLAAHTEPHRERAHSSRRGAHAGPPRGALHGPRGRTRREAARVSKGTPRRRAAGGGRQGGARWGRKRRLRRQSAHPAHSSRHSRRRHSGTSIWVWVYSTHDVCVFLGVWVYPYVLRVNWAKERYVVAFSPISLFPLKSRMFEHQAVMFEIPLLVLYKCTVQMYSNILYHQYI